MTVANAKLRFWCDMSMECVRRDHTPGLSAGDQKGPFLTARALGMALAALNDANAFGYTSTSETDKSDSVSKVVAVNPVSRLLCILTGFN